ncbi:hypothetical protein BG015_009132 [Linnemannia schmuckeri]|uniref:YitH/HolE acetyltransferase (GNAT) domain-containing protein n=1 Tax=Linnemannia schmuckeri TaxID=64567 RepID=A0A9P5RVX7_9FUNG|nr:hypothetical protein BG015_009132 [Linnemannia schmuckeri]
MFATPSPSPPPQALVIHQCKDDEAADLFYDWATRVGWNPGQKAGIRDVMLKTDPHGYFYGKIDPSAVIHDPPSTNNHTTVTTTTKHQEQGREQEQRATKTNKKEEWGKGRGRELVEDPSVISVISAIRFGDDQAWIGCYITDPKYRGRGYGISTFNQALEHVGPTRKSVGLNAVFSQVDNYRRSGFTNPSWVNERRRGSVRDLIEVQEPQLAARIVGGEFDEDLVLLSDERVDWDQLPGIEKRYTGFNRPGFVKDWVRFHASHPEHHRVGVAVLSRTQKDEESGKPLVLGYGCVRPGFTSYRAGPLYARDAETAKKLLVKLAVEVLAADKREPLVDVPLIFDIDIPDQNRASVQMFDGIGWTNTMSTQRLWRGVVPPYDASGCFGISLLEVG